MASSSWKVFPDLSTEKVEYVPFVKSRKFFAVDDSGSTAGHLLKREREFVDGVRNHHTNPCDTICLWGSDCDVPSADFESIKWRSVHGGTSPAQILRKSEALISIQQSVVWFLVTDGEINHGGVPELAHLAQQYAILNVPIVFLIVGYGGDTPEITNISVGISFFAGAQDTLILFKNASTGEIYIIAAKGCFTSLGGSAGVQDLASWAGLPKFVTEVEFLKYCQALEIKVPQVESRSSLPRGISLGENWEEANEGPVWVDLDLLLQAGRLPEKDVFDLLSEEAFNNLAVAYKLRGRTQELRLFVQAQRIEQLAPRLKDVSGAGAIVAQLGLPDTTGDERKVLQGQLRHAHSRNREFYQNAVDNFATSVEAQNARKRNRLVDAAMRTLAATEAASFNADLLSHRSNRARRAEMITAEDSLPIANLDLEGPAYKGYCLICCGDDEVMSICLKGLDAVDDNTTDFALNFPLAAGSSTKNVNMISSQNVCFQCALLAPSGMSIFNEPLKAIVPAVHYDGHNKKYINEQLYLALTTGLTTGAAGIAQLFMAILEEVLRTRSWAGAGFDDTAMRADEQNEALQRKNTFEWMLDQLVQHTRTRETFNELGEWVKFPQALTWIAKDFETNGMASFVVTYPAVGFSKILSLGARTAAFTPDVMRLMGIAKAVYSIAAKYLADMQNAIQNRNNSMQWKQKYLEVIYREFNSAMVPKDLGLDSIVSDEGTFNTRLDTCLEQTRRGVGIQVNEEDTFKLMRKIQIILFWLIYHQKSHCTAQTFFHNINQQELLASAALEPSLAVPENELRDVLLSIFVKEAAEPIDSSAAALHDNLVPFSNPFGASVLRCGIEACDAIFCDQDVPDFSPRGIERIREARTKHLINGYGIRRRFENSGTGLPEPTLTGKPPASIHVNLHIGVARTWAEQSKEKRRAIMDDADVLGDFVADVRKKICEEGRGDIFTRRFDQDIRAVLRSFFGVIRLALRMEGESDEDIAVYEHDFAQNKMEQKAKWEHRAKGCLE
jgi:hypothetical protein